MTNPSSSASGAVMIEARGVEKWYPNGFQALRVALPATVGQFITLLQDTTLLSLIGLSDLLFVAGTVMANPKYLGHNAEVYLTLAVLFWCCCAALGLGSRALERRLDPNPLPSS